MPAASPRLLLLVLPAIAVIVHGGLFAALFPAGIPLPWLLAGVLGLGIGGTPVSLRKPGAGEPLLAAAVAGVLFAVAVGMWSAALRANILLIAWDRSADWWALVNPLHWPALHTRVTELPICCTRRHNLYGKEFQWIFLAGEQLAFLGGAIYGAAYVFRRQRGAGREAARR